MAAALRAGGRVPGAHKERRRPSARAVRAQQQRGGEGDGSDESDSERTIEQLEQRSFKKRSSPSSSSASQPQRKRWEEMTGNEKLWDLWTREKGILWYLNRSAGYSLGFIVVAWIVFRFIGPALGFYQLQKGLNDLPTQQ